MRLPSVFLLVGALSVLGINRASSQAPPPKPAATVAPGPRTDYPDINSLPKPGPPPPNDDYPDIRSLPQTAPAAPDNGYPDIDSLRAPGSSLKLLPAQPTPTPVPGAAGGGVNRPGTTQGGRRAGGGALGRKRNSGRNRDVLVDLADADPLNVRVAYRRDKTIAMSRDPGMAELLNEAGGAKTDKEKRVYLKEYYNRLYAAVKQVDPSPEMKRHVAILTLVTESRYEPKRREVGGDEDITLGRGGGRLGGGRNR